MIDCHHGSSASRPLRAEQPTDDLKGMPTHALLWRFALIAICIVLLVLTIAVVVRNPETTEPPAVQNDTRTVKEYQFASAKELERAERRGYDIVVVKGRPSAAELGELRDSHAEPLLVNYEQAFALNAEEAEFARSKGWLAETCTGEEIHPENIPGVTLLDATIGDALVWRTDLIAGDTAGGAYGSTYLDTLRTFFPDGFYDGTPCGLSHEAWLQASMDTVELVQQKTGKAVIANGSGLQNGRNYFDHKSEADELMALADGVQIEHFLRSRNSMEQDLGFIGAINDAGKDAYVKCARARDACREAFMQAPTWERNFLNIAR